MWKVDETVLNILLVLTVVGVSWLFWGDRFIDHFSRRRRRQKRHAH